MLEVDNDADFSTGINRDVSFMQRICLEKRPLIKDADNL